MWGLLDKSQCHVFYFCVDIPEDVDLHVIGPLGVTIVIVLGAQRAHVVSLAVVVPGDNLNHGETLLEDLVPAVEDQGATREDPVLAEGNLLQCLSVKSGHSCCFEEVLKTYRAEVSEEPR